MYTYVDAAKVMAMKKPNPIYAKESQKVGAYPPSELEKPDKYLPKTQEFTKVCSLVQIYAVYVYSTMLIHIRPNF